jgi:thiamine-phosphate pyrophosphorylase
VILHLVTDRRRLATGAAADLEACLLRQARFAVDAGVDVIQIRERDLEADALARLVSAVLTIATGSGTRVVVNDRLDVALACGAHGVHLRADSFDAGAARRLVPAGFLIGRSVHTAAEAAAAGPVDYLVAGTVFPTESKPPGDSTIGVAGLRAIVASARVPVLAIGGVTETTAGELAHAGVAGAGGIGLFMSGDRSACRAVPLLDRVHRMRAAFDSIRPHP